MDKKGILEKLKKILELADRAATSGEAAAAMEAAMRLQKTYNVSINDIDPIEKEIFFKTKRLMAWKSILMSLVGRYSNVLPIRSAECVMIIGTESDKMIFHYFYEYLAGCIERNCSAHAEKNSYRLGFLDSLGKRLDPMIEEIHDPKKMGRIEKYTGPTRNSKSISANIDRESFDAGVNDGARTPISAGVGGSEKRQRALAST
ncbi:MAG: DUF7168 domain-containing protein [Planktothrix sp.]